MATKNSTTPRFVVRSKVLTDGSEVFDLCVINAHGDLSVVCFPDTFQRAYDLRDSLNSALGGQRDALSSALREIVGQEHPNPFGFDAASIALDDGWRSRARAALAKVQS